MDVGCTQRKDHEFGYGHAELERAAKQASRDIGKAVGYLKAQMRKALETERGLGVTGELGA